MKRSLVCLLAACVGGGNSQPDAGNAYVEVAAIPITRNPDVDLLWVLDDSTSGLEHQQDVTNAFPLLLNTLSSLEGVLPNLHIGVVSSDVGTKGAADPAPGPAIGSG